MNPPTPDAHGYTKFLLTVGAFLCVAAFVVPGLILRDNSALLVSEDELRGLTPLAQQEISDRQDLAETLGCLAPFIALGLFGAGAMLIWHALPRLRRQEEDDERRGSMEREKLQRELEPQSEAEKMAKLARDQEEMEEPSDRPVARGRDTHKVAREWLRSAEVGEALILSRLAEIAPPLYELRPRVRIPGSPALLLDALLIGSVDQARDIVVEIKVGRAARGARQGIAQAVSLLGRYRERVDREAMAWVIVVVDGPVGGQVRHRLAQEASGTGEPVHLTILEEVDIDHLLLPASWLG